MANQNLNAAKNAKKDEFYTQLVDIENELKHYKARDTGAMQGRIDNLEVVLALDGIRIQREGLDACQIYVVHLAADDADAVVAAVPKYLVVGGHGVHLIDDALVVRWHNLPAVAPIHLVALSSPPR